jgi:hypothetical protein
MPADQVLAIPAASKEVNFRRVSFMFVSYSFDALWLATCIKRNRIKA